MWPYSQNEHMLYVAQGQGLAFESAENSARHKQPHAYDSNSMCRQLTFTWDSDDSGETSRSEERSHVFIWRRGISGMFIPASAGSLGIHRKS